MASQAMCDAASKVLDAHGKLGDAIDQAINAHLMSQGHYALIGLKGVLAACNDSEEVHATVYHFFEGHK